MNYGFFDYKYNIQGFSSDLFSTPHIVFIVLAFISAVLIAAFTSKTKKSTVEKFLKIASVAVAVFEITKITWESYYDITTGQGFNTGGILPLYTCSVFIYSLILAAWTKGKTKEIALSFLTTVSLISGAIGVVQCNGLNYYPFWTFGAFYSMFFHYAMLATGVFLLGSGYKKLEWKDALLSFVAVFAVSIAAIPVNYIVGSDYMLVYSAGGVPFMSSLADKMAAVGLRPLFTVIMLLTYIPLAAIVVAVYKGIVFLIKKRG